MTVWRCLPVVSRLAGGGGSFFLSSLFKKVADGRSSSMMRFGVGARCWLLRQHNVLAPLWKTGGGSWLAVGFLPQRIGAPVARGRFWCLGVL